MSTPTKAKPRSLRRYLPLALIVAGVVAVGGGLAWLVLGSLDDGPAGAPKKNIQQVQLIRPPPPPPEVEPPPPPPPEEVDVPEPEPEPEVADSDEPPPGEQLGLDADGVAGSDAFGLAARKGGRDLLASGSDGRFAWYGNLVKNDIMERLAEVREIRQDRYSIVVRLWLAPDGSVQEFKLAGSTGDAELDRQLLSALGALGRISETPPPGLPQPVRVRIVSRI